MYSLPQCGTMANKIETSSKNIKPRANLNHNIYNMTLYGDITVETLLTIKLINTSMDLTVLTLLVQRKHL